MLNVSNYLKMTARYFISTFLVLISFQIKGQISQIRPFEKDSFLTKDQIFILRHNLTEFNGFGEVISDPTQLENCKKDLKITHTIECIPVEYAFCIIKNHSLVRCETYCDSSEVFIGKKIRKSLYKVRLHDKQLVKSQYTTLVNSLNKNGILWFSRRIEDFVGRFDMIIETYKQQPNTIADTLLFKNLLYKKLISLNKNLDGRISFIFMADNGLTVNCKVQVRGNRELYNMINTMNFDNDFIKSRSMGEFEDSLYLLTYIETYKKKK